eukprot:6215365-Amphidinium_carterae.1
MTTNTPPNSTSTPNIQETLLKSGGGKGAKEKLSCRSRLSPTEKKILRTNTAQVPLRTQQKYSNK